MAEIKVDGLKKAFGSQVVLDWISFEVKEGETCLIEGSAAGEPLIAAVYEEVLAAGGNPVVAMAFEGQAAAGLLGWHRIRVGGASGVDARGRGLAVAWVGYLIITVAGLFVLNRVWRWVAFWAWVRSIKDPKERMEAELLWRNYRRTMRRR